MKATAAAMATQEDLRKEDEKYAEVLRNLVKQENDVTNHRTTWLLVTQGILFAAASTLIKTEPVPTIAIAVLGILTALSFGHVLKNSAASRQHLKGLWRKRVEERGYRFEEFAPMDGGFPSLKVIAWLQPWFFLPKLVIATWAVLILYRILR